MNRALFYNFILAAVVLAPNVTADWWSVGSLAKFQFHSRNDTEMKLEYAIVGANVTQQKVKDLLVKFNPSRPTKILIHGWMNTDTDTFANDLVQSYVPNFDYNVITVDWRTESFDFYPLSVVAVRNIGHVVAQLVDILVNSYKASLSDIHIIGHSLGAHVAGIAGLSIKAGPGKVGRITGLDPAHPLFSMTTKDRLRPESGAFVDVIHTCSNFLSFMDTLGHVDFYPNLGIAPQPGCEIKDLTDGTGCSHSRSFEYFAESITSPTNFPAKQCSSGVLYALNFCSNNPEIYMGEYVPESASGTYHLKTNSKSPFGIDSKQ